MVCVAGRLLAGSARLFSAHHLALRLLLLLEVNAHDAVYCVLADFQQAPLVLCSVLLLGLV